MLFEARGLTGGKHADEQLDPVGLDVGHHLERALADGVPETGQSRVGRVGLEMKIIDRPAIGVEEQLDDAEPNIDGVEDLPILLFGGAQRPIRWCVRFVVGHVGANVLRYPCTG